MSALTRFQTIYKSVDGQDIDVDVYVPQGGEKCPVLINIHGGAFMLGSSRMVNLDQVEDCLNRGWIVLSPNHRLCPQVNLLEGPMRDCRDLLAWVYDGGLEKALSEASHSVGLDLDHVFAFGTSSGAMLALSLGFGVPRPVAGIYEMYGPCNFSDPFWSTPLPHVAARLPEGITDEFINRVFDVKPVPITGGVSLEGQAPGPPDFSDPRQAYAMSHIARGKVPDAIFPSRKWEEVDPALNITLTFPPTFIVHGAADTMVPIHLSQGLLRALEAQRVKCKMVEIPGEEHTFAAKMKVGSQTWNMQREGFDFLASLIGKS